MVGDASTHPAANYLVEDLQGNSVSGSIPRDQLYWGGRASWSGRQETLFTEADFEDTSVTLDQFHPGPLGTDTYSIGRIGNERKKSGNGRREIEVFWAGFEEPTWVPESTIDESLLARLRKERDQPGTRPAVATRAPFTKTASTANRRDRQ